MGSPISPIVSKLYMEDFEINTIRSAEHTPRMGRRYVDDTFVVQKVSDKESFLELFNSIDPCIQFTVDNTRADGSMPVCDTLVMPEPDRDLRKPY